MYLRKLAVSRIFTGFLLATLLLTVMPVTRVAASVPADTISDAPVAPVCEVYTYSDTDTVGAVELSDANIHGNWLKESELSPAQWIWTTDPIADTTIDVEETFSDEFTVAGEVLSATLEFASDNGYLFTLNEDEVA